MTAFINLTCAQLKVVIGRGTAADDRGETVKWETMLLRLNSDPAASESIFGSVSLKDYNYFRKHPSSHIESFPRRL